MMDIKFRNTVFKFLYKNVLKRLFFKFDPESVHDLMTKIGALTGRFWFGRNMLKLMYGYSHPMLEQEIVGIKFKNPIGLAAGFDKNAELSHVLPALGFGFEEVGSVTGEPCPGNPGKRLWRLKNSQSLVVYYGLKNDGCDVISERLKNRKFDFPLGISIAKTNNKETVDEQAGINDYVKAYTTFKAKNIGDYFTINISCPNTFGGEPFTDPGKLERLMAALNASDKFPPKPVFLKLPAELPFETIDHIVVVAKEYGVRGLICTNLAKSRVNSKIDDNDFVPDVGGMSGKVVQDLSDKLIAHLYSRYKNEFVIVGCGGVFNAEDAYRKIKLGASLIQMITGMIFEGPQVISEINFGLVQLLRRDGYKNIADAVGKSNLS